MDGMQTPCSPDPQGRYKMPSPATPKGYEDDPSAPYNKNPYNYSIAQSAEPSEKGSSKATQVPHHHVIPQLHTQALLNYCY